MVSPRRGCFPRRSGSSSCQLSNGLFLCLCLKAVGNDESHVGSEPACLTATIAQPAPKPEPGKPVYSCTVGSGSTWTKGSGEDLAFTFKRTAEGEEKDTAFAHFTSASMDGKELTRDQDYVATEGSVVITLKASYLEGLSTGEHTLTATFDDGSVDAALAVTDASADNVTVAFDGNGASSGAMDKVMAARGSKLTLPANAFARDGYTFSGWNTAKDGSGTDANPTPHRRSALGSRMGPIYR